MGKKSPRKVIAALLDEAGISYTEGHGKNHPWFEFHVNGKRHKQIYTVNCGDPRMMKNCIAQVRKKLTSS